MNNTWSESIGRHCTWEVGKRVAIITSVVGLACAFVAGVQYEHYRAHLREIALNAAVATAPPLLTVDERMTILTANDSAAEATQYSIEELVGSNAETLIPLDYIQRHRTARDKANGKIKTGVSHRIVCDLLRKDQTRVGVVVTLRWQDDPNLPHYAVRMEPVAPLPIAEMQP